MEQLIGSRLRKEYDRAVCCHPVCLIYTQHIMRNAGLDELQVRIKIVKRNISNLRYVDDTTLNGRKWRGTKEPVDAGKGAEYSLRLNIKKTKIMASGPITSWQIEGENMEAVTYFLFLGSKITVEGDSSREIRRWLLLSRKVMTNLANVLKSRDITLPTRVCLVKALVFPVVTYCCESWTVKKAEHQRTDAFELWCWRSLLRVP